MNPAARDASTRVVAAAIATVTIAGCGLSLAVTLISVRLDALGYSAGSIGISVTLSGIAALTVAPLAPYLARRIGVAPLLVAALLVGGLALASFPVVVNYFTWLALRFLVSACVTILFVLSEFWINAAVPPRRRGLAIGLYATSLSIGFAIGPVLLALVGPSGSLPFLLGAALFWCAIPPLVFGGRGAPEIVAHRHRPLWRFLTEAPAAMFAGLLHGSIEVGALSLLPVYALRAGVTAADGAAFASLYVLGNGATQIPLGLLADRLDRRRLLAALAGLGIAGALGLAALGVGSLALFEVLLLVWGGVAGGFYPVGLTELGAQYRDDDLASANAAFIMAYSLGMLVGPPLIGLGLDAVPPGGLFLAIAALMGLYLAANLWGTIAPVPVGAPRSVSPPQS